MSCELRVIFTQKSSMSVMGRTLLAVCVFLATLPRDSWGQNVGYFLHLTDVHVNPYYHVTNSLESYCVESSGKPSKPLGPYGEYECDPPMAVVESGLRFIRSQVPRLDFIAWTGDNIVYLPPTMTMSLDRMLEMTANLTRLLDATFPGVRVLPVIGNNDIQPPDNIPVSANLPLYSRLLLDSNWLHFLDQTGAGTFRKGGYYSQMISDRLRIVGLNSFIWCDCNKGAGMGVAEDPTDQLDWLDKELKSARGAVQKVLIISHVPTGYHECHKDNKMMHSKYNEAYIDALMPYSDIIVGQLWGHAHTDTFRVIKNRYGKAALFGLIAPALTPAAPAHNPSLRVFKYDTLSGTLLDYDQYYMDLAVANSHRQMTWHHAYSASKLYELANLTADSMASLLDRFHRGLRKSEAFSSYMQFNQFGPDRTECDPGDGGRHQLCAIEFAREADYKRCVRQYLTSTAAPHVVSHPAAAILAGTLSALLSPR